MMKKGWYIWILLGIIYLIPGKADAQLFEADLTPKYDTSYITVYKDELTTRLYLSRKQNGYNLATGLLDPWIKYRTNDVLQVGLGYTYSFLTLNLAVKFPFINVDDDLYGESRYIDLQAHTYFRSIIIDFYLQWNKGYYMANPENVYPVYPNSQARPLRGDLRTNILGLNVQYLFNSERYSYKAAFVQNEFQRKSAGSPIVGLEAVWLLGMSDSATIGRQLPKTGYLDDQPFNQMDAINGGVNAGYAYTFVWKEALYLSLSTSFGLSLGKNYVHYSPDSETVSSAFSFGLSNSTLISLGFNSKNYYVGLSFIRYSLNHRLSSGGEWLGYHTGNIRFNIVKRFITKRPIKALRPDLWIF